MYRVTFFDKSGRLLCWYSTPNKKDAERMAKSKYDNVVVETIYE